MFENHEWKIKVEDRPWNLEVAVWLVKKGYNPSLAHIKNGRLELTELKEGLATDPEPTFVFPLEVWTAIKDMLIDKKVRDKNEVESELIATKYHLEDMRLLALKLKK